MERARLFPFLYVHLPVGAVIVDAYTVDDFGNAVRVAYTPVSYRDGGGFGASPSAKRAVTLEAV